WIRPTRNFGLPFMAQSSSGEQRIELALLFERVKIVAATDMRVADEDLRKRRSAICPLDHLFAQFGSSRRIVLGERHAFACQELPCRVRVVAEIARVDHHLSHSITPDEKLTRKATIWAFSHRRHPSRR